MVNTVAGILLGPDTHANRPAATAVSAGTLYSCSDHDLLYQSDGATWETWATVGGAASTEQALTFSQTGTLAVAAGTLAFVAPFAMTVVGVRAHVGTAPTGASLIVDVHQDGTTIFTTQGNRPTIAASGTTSGEETPDVTAIAEDDELTVDIDQVGSTIAGADLTVVISYT
jgi:threonine aldolase